MRERERERERAIETDRQTVRQRERECVLFRLLTLMKEEVLEQFD